MNYLINTSRYICETSARFIIMTTLQFSIYVVYRKNKSYYRLYTHRHCRLFFSVKFSFKYFMYSSKCLLKTSSCDFSDSLVLFISILFQKLNFLKILKCYYFYNFFSSLNTFVIKYGSISNGY